MIPIKWSREEKQEIVERVVAYFAEERGETIGHLAAEQILDVVAGEIGPYFYNKAIGDARAVLVEKFNQTEDELYALEQPLARKRR